MTSKFSVYLDESKVQRWATPAERGKRAREVVGDRLMVGAVVAPDTEPLEAAVAAKARSLLAEDQWWVLRDAAPAAYDRRQLFARQYFHFVEDSQSIRQEAMQAMVKLDFRAHVFYSHLSLDPNLSAHDLQTVMYFNIARNLLQRYAGAHLEFIFENETDLMHRRYGKLVHVAAESLDRLGGRTSGQPRATAEAKIAYKPNGGLSTVDYCLGIANLWLHNHHQDTERGSIQNFQLEAVEPLNKHIAHIANFDAAIHRQKFDILRTPSRTVAITGANSRSGDETPITNPISSGATGPFSYVRDANGLAAALSLEPRALEQAVELAQRASSYRFPTLQIRGKLRRLSIPTRQEVLTAQQRLANFLSPLNDLLHPSCSAYVPGRSALDAAMPHSGGQWVQTLDIKNFFPSTTSGMVQRALGLCGATEEVAALISGLSTHSGALPTGARTSPLLSNLVLRDFDFAMAMAAASKGLRYSRYADDMIFSGAEKFSVELEASDALAAIGYALNDSKSRLRKRGQAIRIAGLTVFERDGPRIPKRLKRRLRLELFLVEKALTATKEMASTEAEDEDEAWQDNLDRDLWHQVQRVRGLYLYCLSVEPNFARRLVEGFELASELMRPRRSLGRRAAAVGRIIRQIDSDITEPLTVEARVIAEAAPLGSATAT